MSSSSSGSAGEPSRKRDVHLVFLIHGLYGSPSNLNSAMEELRQAADTRPSRSTSSVSSSSRPLQKWDEEDEDEVQALLSDWEPEGYSSARGRASTPRRRKRSSVPPPPPYTPSVDPDSASAHNGAQETQADGRGGEEVEEVVIYAAKSFEGSRTWDGIDVNAHRAAEELKTEIARLEEDGYRIAGLSIMGYSLGGSRYLVGLLSRSPSFWLQYPPRTFSTAATPHLGQLKYRTTMNAIMHTLGRRLFSRTGQQLFALDKDAKGRCLLEVMAEPRGMFVRGLQRFDKILIVANGCNDRTVPYPTASISIYDPFVDHEHSPSSVEIDHDRNLVLSWTHPEGSIHRASSMLSLDVRRPSMVRLESKDGIGGLLRTKPPKMRLPPIFILKWPGPFKYSLFLLLPFVIPLWLCFVSVVFTIHTIQSSKRINMVRNILHEAFHHDHEDSSEPLMDGDVGVPNGDRLASLRSSGRSSPEASGAATPPLLPPDFPPNRIPLLLKERQKEMVRNLDSALPKMERLIGWYPWVYNTHATLILRDVKRFPFQEEGRPVLKAWAEWVVA